MSKGRALTLWLGLAILAYIFASQDWYALSMSPKGEAVKLSSYDGLTTYGSLSPTLMLNFAAVLVVAFVGSLGRKITLALIALVDLITLVSMFFRVQAQDITGLAKQVEQMTGIAAAHGVEDLATTTQGATTLFLVSLAALSVWTLVILFTERKWPKRVAMTQVAAKNGKETEPEDAIGIWDSQRR